MRTMMKLRTQRASFSAKLIQQESGLQHVSAKTIYRTLCKNGYRYRQSRKKGLSSGPDKKKRLRFAKLHRMKNREFWTKEITFYFDGVGFAHHGNLYSDARTVSLMAWKKPGEGLEITTKERKELILVVAAWPTSLYQSVNLE